MEPKKINHKKVLDFLISAADFKNYVFIFIRKQTRQKMEGFCAS